MAKPVLEKKGNRPNSTRKGFLICLNYPTVFDRVFICDRLIGAPAPSWRARHILNEELAHQPQIWLRNSTQPCLAPVAVSSVEQRPNAAISRLKAAPGFRQVSRSLPDRGGRRRGKSRLSSPRKIPGRHQSGRPPSTMTMSIFGAVCPAATRPRRGSKQRLQVRMGEIDDGEIGRGARGDHAEGQGPID